MATISFRVWGRACDKLGISGGQVRVSEDENAVDRVVARLERDSGLKAWRAYSDGTAVEKGKPVAHHYHVTFGRPAKGGGLNVEGEVWFSIPVES